MSRPEARTTGAALAEIQEGFRQRGWLMRGIEKERRREVFFIHARRQAEGGMDEVIVTARVGDCNGAIMLRFYALPAVSPEWLTCDRAAFDGFLDSSDGLARGWSKVKRTVCTCGKGIHRSGGRAMIKAHQLQEQYHTQALQRAYRCDLNIRSFHLSSHLHGVPIPGARLSDGDAYPGKTDDEMTERPQDPSE